MHSSPSPLISVLTIFIFFLSSDSISRSFIPFSNSINVTLFGGAVLRNGSISLTQERSCAQPPNSSSGIGRAFHVSPIRFLDPYNNKSVSSFSCRFSFTISHSPLCPFGDGLAFLITSNIDSFSLMYGRMGLPDWEPESQDRFFAVEFDTNFDPLLQDVNDNHIGIDLNSVVSVVSVNLISKGIDLRSDRKMTAWVEYKDGDKKLMVWVGYTKMKPLTPLLVASIDLSQHFKEFMHVGFSASNGRGSALHLLDEWRFKSSIALPSTMSMEDSFSFSEEDCFMCSQNDNDLYVENGLSNNRKLGRSMLELALLSVGLIIVLLSVCAIFGLCTWCVIKRRRIKSNVQNERQFTRFQAKNRIPKRLSLMEIKSATKGFNRKMIIGEGASAVVYQGSLPSGGTVAVKRFSKVTQIGSLRNQFATELATVVGCLRHKNLVQLQGWCCEGPELVLVYEYMPNGSLARILHKPNNPLLCFLTWEKRVKVILGIASALVYLHEECERQIIHRDVKSCNIMLDDEFIPKLGDFGLAEAYDHSCSTRDATLPAGTMGYLAPEYVYLGVPTVKTDVYSFGMVVLEVATGRKPVDEGGLGLSDWVWGLWGKGCLMEAVDVRLNGRFNMAGMERMLMVGLVCVHPKADDRPMVREAARMVKGEAPLPILPARKPMVSILSVVHEDSDQLMRSDGGLENVGSPWLTPSTHFSS
ncbi:L-type lectin-domain containing receptor kinase S.6 [Impatiens glandulifera]|uniref:L-type lectin-domain containing receptor kinase S.6 n=1 Tax=Impatiens glandulifera TaxID=253017 RepID=UPI001FB12932|nr:L-type lectin-domain containing receptor kinase S.6 [Impatiens glandulifera]